jgi:hypothetical protein
VDFVPGTLVKVVKGAFAGPVGVVLDPKKAVDPRGKPYPTTLPGYYWVLLTLNDTPIPGPFVQG